TTAASIWVVAALGVGAGAGETGVVFAGLGIALAIMLLLPVIENEIDRLRTTRTLTVTCGRGAVERVEAIVAGSHVRQRTHSVGRDGDTATLTWAVRGQHDQVAALIRQLFDDPDVASLVS